MSNDHFDKLVPDAVFDDESGARSTGLTAIVEDRDRGKHRRLFEVCICKHDVRTLAAKFQESTFQIGLPRVLHELLTNFCGARKRQTVDVVVQGEVSAKTSTRTWQNLQHAVGQSGFASQCGNAQCR